MNHFRYRIEYAETFTWARNGIELDDEITSLVFKGASFADIRISVEPIR